MDDLLLKIHNLEKVFSVKASAFSNKKLLLKAVDKFSIELRRGETLGLVGESGCGKTTVGRSLTRIYEPDGGRVFLNPDKKLVDQVIELDEKREELEVQLEENQNRLALLPKEIKAKKREAKALLAEDKAGEGEKLSAEISDLTAELAEIKMQMPSLKEEIKQLKSNADSLARHADLLVMEKDDLRVARQNIQMVFQDPWASLNPRMIVKDLIAEGPREYKTHSPKEIDALVSDILEKVGLPPVAATRYPHEFSGGQRQRIGIARALALNPSLIVCDEPVSALDVSIQAQVLNLLITLQKDYDLTYVFIAHDLSVVQYISDRVAVMYLGNLVELAENKVLYEKPRHPYTVSLLKSVPIADPDVKPSDVILEGDVPSPVNPPSGCPFHPRCPRKQSICAEEKPIFEEKSPGHWYACHNPEPV
jgi:oligopeptide/dipeptide ABC transporter ATP-binding protein